MRWVWTNKRNASCVSVKKCFCAAKRSQAVVSKLQKGLIYGKNCAGPEKGPRSQGGVRFPTGGNGAADVESVASAVQARRDDEKATFTLVNEPFEEARNAACAGHSRFQPRLARERLSLTRSADPV